MKTPRNANKKPDATMIINDADRLAEEDDVSDKSVVGRLIAIDVATMVTIFFPSLAFVSGMRDYGIRSEWWNGDWEGAGETFAGLVLGGLGIAVVLIVSISVASVAIQRRGLPAVRVIVLNYFGVLVAAGAVQLVLFSS